MPLPSSAIKGDQNWLSPKRWLINGSLRKTEIEDSRWEAHSGNRAWTGRSGGLGRWKADQIGTTYKLRMQALSWS